jgi:hypothetical protein
MGIAKINPCQCGDRQHLTGFSAYIAILLIEIQILPYWNMPIRGNIQVFINQL